jgi:hypothetical protein
VQHTAGAVFPTLVLEVPLTLTQQTIVFRCADLFGNREKRRRLLIPAIVNMLLFSSCGNAFAAEPYEGQWNGSATAAQDSRCKAAKVAMTVQGQEVGGEATFGTEVRKIKGTVRPNGTFGGTLGFQHLVGNFKEETFEGAFRSFNCDWILILKRSQSRAPSEPQAPTSAGASSRRSRLPWPGSGTEKIAMADNDVHFLIRRRLVRELTHEQIETFTAEP